MSRPDDPAPLHDLPIPDFYRSENARDWSYAPDQHALFLAARAWRKEHGLRPASADRRRIHLLVVDGQKDFCFPRGTLYVGGRSGTGAMDDSDRIARFIYRNLENLTDVTCTLDTHFPFQIFSPSFWLDANGEPPAPHQEITTEDIRAGRVRPNPDVVAWVEPGIDEAWLEKQVEFYCQELEKAGKYKLYLWPPHCLLGSDGHPLVGVIHEARLFHAWARGAQGGIEIKGSHPLTENYSVLSPEVLFTWDGRQIAYRNARFIQTLLTADASVIAGQAASHCVRSSVDDLLVEIAALDPELARKLWILADCMSAVAVPDPEHPGKFVFDFTPQAEEALERWAAAGAHVVRSTDPMAEWSLNP
ncbi:MAG TPA: nicotinamidase [Thermoanaerobaculia bacterium]|nr:nicotinamidase [Thermoanaerobaculia bacterium]